MDKLAQERYQDCCTGEKNFPSLLCRSGDDWLVGIPGNIAVLKSSVRGNPNQPPRTGWLFFKESKVAGENHYKEDPSLTCTIPVDSPPCCLTVSLSGPAKKAHGDCEGEYKSTELMSMGRPVSII